MNCVCCVIMPRNRNLGRTRFSGNLKARDFNPFSLTALSRFNHHLGNFFRGLLFNYSDRRICLYFFLPTVSVYGSYNPRSDKIAAIGYGGYCPHYFNSGNGYSLTKTGCCQVHHIPGSFFSQFGCYFTL
ncbi:MAG: hypothetical protein ACD_13C00144G0072 [uncultured bacterium]|nr:MAG: hypothetical protein ACD_13C00144G0072 [uncultured bacterium]